MGGGGCVRATDGLRLVHLPLVGNSMSLQSFFQTLEQLPPSVFIRSSAWLGAMINVAHLMCLVMLAGAVLIVDLRLLGVGVTRQPVAPVARDARAWFLAALVGMLLTGVPQ